MVMVVDGEQQRRDYTEKCVVVMGHNDGEDQQKKRRHKVETQWHMVARWYSGVGKAKAWQWRVYGARSDGVNGILLGYDFNCLDSGNDGVNGG